MLKPFMRPHSGEDVYVPDDTEAVLARDALSRYIAARLEQDFDLVLTEPRVLTRPKIEGEADPALALLVNGSDAAILGEALNGAGWVDLSYLPSVGAYRGMGERLLRYDLTFVDDHLLDQLRIGDSGRSESMSARRGVIIEEAIAGGAFTPTVIGLQEATALTEYLDAGKVFVPAIR
jgi:hypothetical protein